MNNENQGTNIDTGRELDTLTMIVTGIGVFLSVAHLFLALFPWLSELQRNILHFAGFSIMCALIFPIWGKDQPRSSRSALLVDIAIAIIVFGISVHLAFAEDWIYERGVRLSTIDWITISLAIIASIELTRRASGLVIPILIVLSLTYVAFWGRWLDGVFSFPGLSVETVLFRSVYGDFALFGTIASISSTYVFLFIIFGAFLIRSGAGDFVVDAARILAGRLTGGPGLIAVIASALTGTISGSAIANTASTGVITIPLMKRAGFPAKFAGGVEAAASTGGQLMPPIMGAGAFVMSSFTQISYEYIVLMATLPAILYFLAVAFFVRIEARRLNLTATSSDGPTLMQALRDGGASFIIPISVLITLLVSGFTPTYAAVIGILTVIVSSWLTKNPMGPRGVFEALAIGARNMVPTAVILCAVGLVVNVITTAGVGNTFSLMISDWSNGNLLIAIALVALASLVLGMGLPVTAAYIVLATLSAPALAGMISDLTVIQLMADGSLPEAAKPILMLQAPETAALLNAPMPYGQAADIVAGLPLEIIEPLRQMAVPQDVAVTALLSAHMIIFWLSQDSNVTPPVCLAAFTAATIAKSPPMATGIASWKLAKGLYILPIMFAYTPLLSGDWNAALVIFFFAVFGIYGLAAALQGAAEYSLPISRRIIFGLAGIACIWPNSLLINAVGAVVGVGSLLLNMRLDRHTQPAAVATL
ncbi:MAG: TRAP transporter fused permease subunit [Hyphomicrobiales bacterium]|nr:TRAP transporter fused permease subunit [Hyphomicrobiales bacterium]